VTEPQPRRTEEVVGQADGPANRTFRAEARRLRSMLNDGRVAGSPISPAER
jgi:hypothetical protein